MIDCTVTVDGYIRGTNTDSINRTGRRIRFVKTAMGVDGTQQVSFILTEGYYVFTFNCTPSEKQRNELVEYKGG